MRAIFRVLAFLLAPAPLAFAGPVDYVRDVKPLLQERCVSCHGALRQKAGLRLDTAELARKGGKHGPAVVPGKPDASPLIDAVTANARPLMPPENEGTPLTEAQVRLLRQWIAEGATSPHEVAPADPRSHWAFRPPVRSIVPPFTEGNPVDGFLEQARLPRGLRARPEADRPTLLRRVTLDLTGLPPTRAELHAFLADDRPGAYERVVERLLASPQYGERWARHWMDVWRYSDWYGRRAVPDVWNSAPQIWRWRDWIVRSLNADRGYDRMVAEMLAADEVCPGDDEAAVATGFLVRNWYALNPHQWMRDNVEHTAKAFLGLTFNCAHCHDHKYDPISQEEYFRFRAFFEPLDLRQDRVPGETDPGPFQKYEYSVLRKVVPTGLIRVRDDKVDAPTHMYRLGDERDRFDRPPVAPGGPAFLNGDRLRIEPVKLPDDDAYPGLKPFVRREELGRREQAVAAARQAIAGAKDSALRLAEARLATAEAELKSLQLRIAADDVKYGRAVGDGAHASKAASRAEREAVRATAREKLLQAELAQPAAKPEVVAAAKKAVEAAEKALATEGTTYAPLAPVYAATSSGRRRALASWITARDNPLTARVAVNHAWLRHFDHAFVESVFDFGRNGKAPSHPELLDWLAVEFMESGWSMKHLHRLLVTSAAYRMQSAAGAVDDPCLARDPDNRYLWRFPAHRIEAEAVRDAVLAVSGELDRRLGGAPLDNQPDSPSRRRSLYFSVYPEDGGQLRFLESFDAPDPCDCYRRSASLVPQQALVLTNSKLLLNQSRLLARRLAAEMSTDAAFVRAAFETVLSRPPTAAEEAACGEFLRRQTEALRGAGAAPAIEGVVPPAKEPAPRAREGLVRALFSHDEFVTIR